MSTPTQPVVAPDELLDRELAEADPEVHAAIAAELARQRDTLEMIASENFAPVSVMAAQGSVLPNPCSSTPKEPAVTVETLPRTAPLQSWSERFAALPADVRIEAEPFVAMVNLRVCPAAPATAAVAAHLGVALPTEPSTWVEGDTARVIWLGPDEWLVTSPSRGPRDLEAGLCAAVRPGGSVVDVSAQRTTLRLRGTHVRDVLATGCALDLHPRAFAAGSAAQTTLGLAGVVLLALDDTATHYQLHVRSSYARYLATWLLDAASEFSTEVGTEFGTEFGTEPSTEHTDPGREA